MFELEDQERRTLEVFLAAGLFASVAAHRLHMVAATLSARLYQLTDRGGFNDILELMVHYALYERGPEEPRIWANKLYPLVTQLQGQYLRDDSAFIYLQLASAAGCGGRRTMQHVASRELYVSQRTFARRLVEVAGMVGESPRCIWLAFLHDMYQYIDAHPELLLEPLGDGSS